MGTIYFQNINGLRTTIETLWHLLFLCGAYGHGCLKTENIEVKKRKRRMGKKRGDRKRQRRKEKEEKVSRGRKYHRERGRNGETLIKKEEITTNSPTAGSEFTLRRRGRSEKAGQGTSYGLDRRVFLIHFSLECIQFYASFLLQTIFP